MQVDVLLLILGLLEVACAAFIIGVVIRTFIAAPERRSLALVALVLTPAAILALAGIAALIGYVDTAHRHSGATISGILLAVAGFMLVLAARFHTPVGGQRNVRES